MPQIFIDGKAYEAKARQTIIQIADGINCGGVQQVDIPRFCYHPALSIAGNCRMCLVEVGTPKIDPTTKSPVLDEHGNPVIAWSPKPLTACSTEISDGMHVKTHHTSTMVREAQKGVLEFILINHPLDCPTCDQAGECPLQQITYKYGPEGSRYEFEKVHKPKRVAWGTKITFDGERCINCTRCVRFFDEYTKTFDLEIVQRGWNNYPNPADPKTLDENPYAMNIIDLCPVGALTSTDHRFKARVWEMSATDTIAVNDARCSSIQLWVRDNKIMRITPRYNPLVNGYFIADETRLNFRWVNENRVSGASIKVNGAQQPADWSVAIAKAAELLRRYAPEQIFIMASAKACLEANYLAKKLAYEVIGTPHLDFIEHFAGEDDHLLIRADKTPNRMGCELLGIASRGILAEELSDAIKLGKIKCVVVMEDEISTLLSLDALLKLDALIVMPYNHSDSVAQADVVLPAATFAEIIGTYVNFEGVVQLARPAKALKHQNRELMKEMALSRLDKHGTQFDKWHTDLNKVDAKPSWMLLSDLAHQLGAAWSYSSAREIFNEIAQTFSAFEGLDYKKLGKFGMKLQKVQGGHSVVA